MTTEKATLGAGCFWQVEESFRTVKGVKKTEVGYMGGHTKNPSYKEVCSDTTGHVEVCQVTFDPKVITYTKILEMFWHIHDPTQINRQGPDVGEQYRSVIFYHSEKQKKTAEQSKKKVAKKIKKEIATAIEKAKTFYPAEESHQKYLLKHHMKGCGF